MAGYCESCGGSTRVPRRRCNHCNKLVCVSKCWSKKLGCCLSCSEEVYPNAMQTLSSHALMHRTSTFFVSTPNLVQTIASDRGLINNRYKDNGDGTIIDIQTGLTWMRCSLGQTWNGKICTDNANKFNWHQASQISIQYAGRSNWRLPSIEELKSLVRFAGRPTIIQQAFPNTLDDAYWSSSEEFNGSLGCYVNFRNGKNGANSKDENFFVRLVCSQLKTDEICKDKFVPVTIYPNDLEWVKDAKELANKYKLNTENLNSGNGNFWVLITENKPDFILIQFDLIKLGFKFRPDKGFWRKK